MVINVYEKLYGDLGDSMRFAMVMKDAATFLINTTHHRNRLAEEFSPDYVRRERERVVAQSRSPEVILEELERYQESGSKLGIYIGEIRDDLADTIRIMEHKTDISTSS
tara:strand:- start:171 stop:497 length:327 start_codon:yes stop_codon:yes gene_type:complete